MATTTIHAQLIRYTTNGDQIIVNLKSDGGDITIDRSTNTKLPATVTSAQTLADALGSLAFKNSLGKGEVGLGNVDNTADSAKSVKYATSAGSAGSATKATQDSAGQQINSTYVKSLSISGRTITITKGDNTTSTLTTQDTNTTYGVFAKATTDAAGGTGLVPAPAKGQQGLYLRGDGTWATPTNTVYTHPNSGVTAGTYRSVTVNAQGHVTSGSNPTTLGGYGITDAAAKSHKHVAADITDNIPASKISGTLSLSNIPAGALERLIPVADDTARFRLTSSNAQNGDVVKVTSTGKMYFIKDDTKLSTEDGYEVFAAGTAAAVAWTNVTGRPSSMPASDVYAWAKAASKPSYSKGEVGLGNVDNTADANKSVKYATSAGSAGSVAWTNVSGRPSSLPASDVYAWAKAANKPSYSKSEVGLSNVDNTADANKSVKYATSAGSAGSSTTSGSLSSAGTLDTADKLNAFIEGGRVKYALVSAIDGLDGMIKNDGICISTPWSTTGYGHQFYINDNGYDLYHRFRNTSKVNNVDTVTWSSWKQILDSSNYNSYAPTKTGGGASGTWGISISGNAASASSVAWGNVSGRPSSMPASDVYAWAKAANKPSYSKGEVGLGNVDNTADSAKSVKYATSAGSANAVAWANVTGKPSTYAPASHTHNYAGSGSAGGSANSAVKLDSSAGNANTPVYFSGGKPVALGYTIATSVPANAKFTDTNTWRGVQNNLTSTATDQSLSAAQGKALHDTKLGAVNANGYIGMAKPDGSASDWIRTTSSGIIPYQSGGRGSGHGGLGTSSWYFSSSYVDNTFCNKSTIADKVRMEFDTTNNCLNFVFL